MPADKSSSKDHESDTLIRSIPILAPWLNDYSPVFRSSQVEEGKVPFYEPTSVSEINFIHPWLQRKQRLMKQTTIKKKQWRKDRKDSDIVNINGKEQKWKYFKTKFYEDLDISIQNGEQLKFM